jgi:hypothetical protein
MKYMFVILLLCTSSLPLAAAFAAADNPPRLTRDTVQRMFAARDVIVSPEF